MCVCSASNPPISHQFCRSYLCLIPWPWFFRARRPFERSEAEKLLKIKASEADAEAKRLAGVGMANMRAAMAQGFQDETWWDVVGCGGRGEDDGKWEGL